MHTIDSTRKSLIQIFILLLLKMYAIYSMGKSLIQIYLTIK